MRDIQKKRVRLFAVRMALCAQAVLALQLLSACTEKPVLLEVFLLGMLLEKTARAEERLDTEIAEAEMDWEIRQCALRDEQRAKKEERDRQSQAAWETYFKEAGNGYGY